MSENIEIKQSHEVFIGEKDGVFAAVALSKTAEGTILGRYDARFFPQINRSMCASPEVGDQLFERAKGTTLENNWKIHYCGRVLWG